MRIVTRKSLIGAGIGAVLGGLLGGGPVGVAFGAAIGGASFEVATRRRGQAPLTADEEINFQKALKSTKDPASLRAAADKLDQGGYREQAAQLRARARVRELPEDVQAERRRIFRDAFSWDKPEDIEKLADLFDKDSMFDGARKLRLQAGAVRASQEAKASGIAAMPATSDALHESLVAVVKQFGPDSEQAKDAATMYLHALTGSEPEGAAVLAAIVDVTPPAPEAPPPAAETPAATASAAEVVP